MHLYNVHIVIQTPPALTHKRKILHDADQVGREGILLASRPSEEKGILSSLSALNLAGPQTEAILTI